MAHEPITSHRPEGGSVVLQATPRSLVHRAPHRLQVRLGGDLDAPRAIAAARLVARAVGAPTAIELDLTRVTYLAAEAVERTRATLPDALVGGTQLVIRTRPGPVAEVIESAGLAEEDGGPATLVCVRAAVRPPDMATEVVMRFYEALAGRDWLGLKQLVADRGAGPASSAERGSDGSRAMTIVDHHARAVVASPGVHPLISSTESDGRIVIARGQHVVPARGDGSAAPFRHRWRVAGDQLVDFGEQRPFAH